MLGTENNILSPEHGQINFEWQQEMKYYHIRVMPDWD